MPKRYLILISDAAQTCGVEEFARQLALRSGDRGSRQVLDGAWGEFFRRLRDVDGVLLNFPVVAWKKKLLLPALTALAARLKGKSVVVVLHEWRALDWKRRVVLAPVAALATRLVFSAPEIAEEFATSTVSRLSTGDRRLIPIPPNLLPPAERHKSAARDTLDRQRAQGRMILGQFGSIYPKKQSTAVLDVAATLLARGQDVFVVFVGSFVKAMDDVEQDFDRKVRSAGLEDRVLVTGYVGDDRELFGLFEAVDVFCYLFPEGLTSRRASVLAAALAGRPVVVNAPVRPDALDHHSLYRRLIAAGAVRLVPSDADFDAVAGAVLAAKSAHPELLDLVAETDAVWRDVADTVAA